MLIIHGLLFVVNKEDDDDDGSAFETKSLINIYFIHSVTVQLHH